MSEPTVPKKEDADDRGRRVCDQPAERAEDDDRVDQAADEGRLQGPVGEPAAVDHPDRHTDAVDREHDGHGAAR